MRRVYTDAELADIINWRDTAGLGWDKVAKRFETKYKHYKSPEAIRSAYRNNRYLFDLDDKVIKMTQLKEIARVKNDNSKKARTAKVVLNHLNDMDDFLESVEKAVCTIKKQKRAPVTVNKTKTKGRRLTIELLFSDWQIGKKMEDYNSYVAVKRLKEYTRAALFKIDQYKKLGYNIEKIVLPMLGDIIESSEKHKNSARGTDCSTPAQIQRAIEAMYLHLIVPLAQLRIPIKVIGVPGNHDWNDHGLNMYYPGVEHYSWIIYNTLRLLSEREGFKHLEYHIAKGCFATTEIYGHTVVYEHGVGISTNETKMKNRMHTRAGQIKKHVSYFRMGDKHNISRFNEDTLVVNGAFFGNDTKGVEYSGIQGYQSCAGQIMFAYTPRKDERLPLYDSFTIQLQHIK